MTGETIDQPSVEALDYIGGEGGFCEPLIVSLGGVQHYVLHQMYLERETEGNKWDSIHQKVEYDSQEELESAFDDVQRRLKIDQSLDWLETDRSLGFDIPDEAFVDATVKIRSIPGDQRRS